MELKGKITIFPELKDKEMEDGTIKQSIFCRGTISSKNQAGDYVNKSVNVRFAGKEFPEEKINKLSPEEYYILDIKEGFLAVNAYESSKRGLVRELEIVVLAGKLVDHGKVERKPVEEAPVDDGLPF